MSEIIRLLANDNYIVVNRDLIQIIGLECAVFLSEIATEAVYWEKAGKLQDGWFYSTLDNVERNTSINSYKQRKCIRELSSLGVLEMQVRGMPATRYFRLDESAISCLISNNQLSKNEQQDVQKLNNKMLKNFTSSSSEIKQLDVKKLKGNNTKENSTDNSTKKKSKHAHGEYQHVRLTDEELQKLIDKLGDRKTAHCITFLDEYKERKGYKCKSDYLTILKWVVNAVDEEAKKKASAESGSRVAWIRDAMEDMGA